MVPQRRSLLWLLLCTPILVLGDSPLGDMHETLNTMSETVRDSFEDVFESVENILDHSTLVGQIGPLFKKFLLTKSELKAIVSGILHVIQVTDIVFLIALGWALVPTLELPYTRYWMNRNREFTSTKTYHFVNSISQVARLGMAVYICDMIKIFLIGAGFEIPRKERLTHAFSYIVYTVWAANRLSKVKRFLLCRITGESEGRLQVVNRLGDAMLGCGTLFLILDILNLEMGLAMRGFVAFGSVGTLIFSLAAKDIVSNLLNGIILSASDRIYEGDTIRLHKSGFSGSVHSLGWLETVLRGSDEIFITIPNADLLSQRVCNLSRVHQCQVKQTLRFAYKDSNKLPQLVDDIKTEIRASCPSVITDRSRPFRCFWTGFQGDHLEVTVDAHFRIEPVGDVYFENQQRVLQAIDRAVKNNNMDFLQALAE
jgi:small-conductance mechanosensitive channel